eukprot:TRINITY_DN1894_c0_g1_i1.p1 TRINITY_DN1894_c0_g1~~TRINITY_DN1894_c0_g1_i1.p1  ORF type:complete len:538 (-),score=106.51 TRINITY_DN1894_c0_g1_i1:86-1666(-)
MRTFFLLLLIALCSAQPAPRKVYEKHVDLTAYTSANSYYHFYYNITQTHILACVIADVQDYAGYAAIGFSDSGSMLNSDAVLGYVESNFTAFVNDFYLDGKLAPTARFCALGYPSTCPDTGKNLNCADNLINTFASRSAQYLLIEFERPLIASDACDIAIPLDRPVTVVFSAGPTVFRNQWPYKAQYHSTFGAYNMTFRYIPPAPVTTGVPTTGNPTTGNPTTGGSTTGNPTTGVPTTGVQTTGVQTTGVSTTGAATTGSIPTQAPVLRGYFFSRNLTDNFMDPSTGNLTTNYFGVYYTISNGNISVGIVAEVPTNGWVGFGLSRDGKMVTENYTNDAVIAWMGPNGMPNVADFSIRGTVAPTLEHCSQNPIDSVCPDVTQQCANNIQLISASKVGNYLSVEFTRKLDTGDACDIKITPNVQQFIIFAVGPTTSEAWPYNVQFHDKYANGNQPFTFVNPLPSSSVSSSTPGRDCNPGNPDCECTSKGACVPGYQCINNVCSVLEDSSAFVSTLSSFFVLFLFSQLI